MKYMAMRLTAICKMLVALMAVCTVASSTPKNCRICSVAGERATEIMLVRATSSSVAFSAFFFLSLRFKVLTSFTALY